MSEITRERVRHERRKRELRDRFDAELREILGDEGFTYFTIQMIVGAALLAIALIVAPEPVSSAIGAGILAALVITVAAILVAWGVGELSTRSAEQATERYGRDEDREDEAFIRNMQALGAG